MSQSRDTRADAPAIALSGSPKAVGTLWGETNRSTIHNDLESLFLAPARERGLTTDVLIARSRRFVEIAEQLAPHWIEEAHSIARAAGVEGELYLAFIAGVYRGLFLHEEESAPDPAASEDECTSYTIAPAETAGNAILFHKTRDNVARAQSAFVLRSTSPGIQAFLAVSDASVLAAMMMVNERGLAGSADMMGLDEVRPRFRGMMNTFILRHIAERASCCAEALEIIREFVSRGWYAGGAKTGTHWLFVDREGTALEVSNNAVEVQSRLHPEGVYFSLRADTPGAEALRQAPHPVEFTTFHNVSRHPSLCLETSISGMTVEIDRTCPEKLTTAWVTFPARSLAFPLFMGIRETPRALIDGSVDRAGQAVTGEIKRYEEMEQAIYARQQAIREEARALLTSGHAAKVEELLDTWVQRQAMENLAALQELARA